MLNLEEGKRRTGAARPLEQCDLVLFWWSKNTGPEGICFSFRKNDGSTANKRPDGAAIVSWGHSRNIAWNVTVTDTFARSYLPLTSVQEEAAAERAALLKTAEYEELLARNHTSVLILDSRFWGDTYLGGKFDAFLNDFCILGVFSGRGLRFWGDPPRR